MKKVRHFIILCCLFGLLLPVKAEFCFRTFGVKSGLSNNYVQSILRDQYGFMWFGTSDGLNRYDGYNCKLYTPASSGSFNNSVSAVYEDASGVIWLKTSNGYSYYNRELDVIDRYYSDKLQKKGIPHKSISYLYVDDKKNLWCIVENTLFLYRFERKSLLSLKLPKNKVQCIVSRHNNSYLLFSNGKVAKINWEKRVLQSFATLKMPASNEHSMFLDSHLNLWIYSNYSSFVICLNTKNAEPIHFRKDGAWCSDIVRDITEDRDGRIWIGTNSKGIYILNPKNNEYQTLCKRHNNSFSLSSNHINCLFLDSNNIMWIGTAKQGVAYTNLNNMSFKRISVPEQEDVSCFQEDLQGNLWLGYDGKGLILMNKKKNIMKLYNKINGNLPTDLIIGKFMDSKGRIWFGTYGSGVLYQKNESFHSVSYSQNQEGDSPINYVRHITQDRYGNMWMGTFMKGLYRMDKDQLFKSFTKDNTCLQTNSITGLAMSGNGLLLYIGTSTGLYKLNIQNFELTFLSADPLFAKINVTCLFEDSHKQLWIGTNQGIHIYRPETNKCIHLSEKDGLSNKYILGIAEDLEHNIWITTGCGITHVVQVEDPTKLELQYRCFPYYDEDGIGSIIFNKYSIYCTRAGNILMGGTGCYLMVNPCQIKHQLYKRKVAFTELLMDNQQIGVGQKLSDGRIILRKNIQLEDKIVIDYFDSNFAIDVSAMDYDSHLKIQYDYRLDEKEKWIKIDGNRIYFNKLSPGTYKLQVRVHDPNESSNTISDLVIKVRPPWWQSSIAYLGYLLVLIALPVIAIRAFQKKHQRMMINQKHEMEIAKVHEMDEAKLRFFTNISHDLRTPLSLIITPLEKMMKMDETLTMKDDLNLMHRNAAYLLNEVNQLLDFRKLDQQHMSLNLSYNDYSELVIGVCTEFKPLAQKDNIKIIVKNDPEKIWLNFDKDKMRRILSNLISNAIKFNQKNGRVTISSKIEKQNNIFFLQIQVSDTGIGIKEENKQYIFDQFFQEKNSKYSIAGSGIGLYIVKEYINMHGGVITIANNKPEGCVFTINMPINNTYPAYVQQQIAINNDNLSKIKIPSGIHQNTLLVVEDNDDFRQFIANSLREYYDIFEACNGQQALNILAKHDVRIVVSDVMMPVMDGLQLCHTIKTDINYSHIPVIMLTAKTADEHVLNGLREGADDYITKPFNIEILLLRIQNLIKWSIMNHEKFGKMEINPSQITVSNLDSHLIEKAIKLVEKNIDNIDFSVDDFSEQMGMSRSSLYKKLMQITGRSPLDFMRILRLKRGKQLLEESQLNISQIAFQVGLSPKQFSIFFKKEYGKLPSEYRNQI